MNKEQIGRIIGVVISCIVALLAVFGYDTGVIQPRQAAVHGTEPLARAVGDTNFTNLVTSGGVTAGGSVIAGGSLAAVGPAALNGGLTVDTTAFSVADGTGATVISGTLAVSGTTTLQAVSGQAMTAGGLIAANAGIANGSFYRASAGTTITATNGAAVSLASKQWQPLTSASDVTPTVTIPTAGTLVCVVNLGSYTITLQDTGNQVLASDAALGQYDVLCGYSDGTRFMEIARSNN